MAAVQAWRDYGGAQPTIEQRDRYSLLWQFYTGEWMADPRLRQPLHVYEGARQVYKHTSAVVSLYNYFTYAGDLSTDGQPLPDGTRGAIPIDPQTGDKTADKTMLTAYHELFKMWQWKQAMSFSPKMCAILGSMLVELVDDLERGTVMPHFIWPGYVPEDDLILDAVGNVQRYAIQYPVEVIGREAFGRRIEAENYIYRKEVTPDEIRYYKNEHPFDYDGFGAVQPNPYGFCPATWERHEIVSGNVGLGAIEKTMIQLMQINSTLSQALDFQQRQFATPIGVRGSALRRGQTMTLPDRVRYAVSGSPTQDEIDEARAAQAEEQNLLPMTDNGDFVTLNLNIGDTKELIETLIDSTLRENPEAEYGSKLIELSQATGPGVSRILSPITGAVNDARKNHDPQTIKKLQMATSMIAMRLQEDAYPEDVIRRRSDRYEPFRAYTLDSFHEGLLDCSIPDREVFAETRDEKIARLVQIQTLIEAGDPWVLAEAGVPQSEVDRIVTEKREATERMEGVLAGVSANQASPREGERTNESDALTEGEARQGPGNEARRTNPALGQ